MILRITSEIIIHANIHSVWDVMVNPSEYPAWNPFIISIEGVSGLPIEGTEMKFTVKWKNGDTQRTREVVDQFTPPKQEGDNWEAVWGYYFKSLLSRLGVVRARRLQTLTSVEEGITLYKTVEEFRGWGLKFLPTANIQDGFDRQAEALKAECERRA